MSEPPKPLRLNEAPRIETRELVLLFEVGLHLHCHFRKLLILRWLLLVLLLRLSLLLLVLLLLQLFLLLVLLQLLLMSPLMH